MSLSETLDQALAARVWDHYVHRKYGVVTPEHTPDMDTLDDIRFLYRREQELLDLQDEQSSCCLNRIEETIKTL